MTSSDAAGKAAGPVRPLEWGARPDHAAEVRQLLQAKLARRRRRKLRAAAGATVLVAVLAWAIPVLRSTGAIETAPGHRQRLRLADGSEAELNARSDLRTDFRYGRRVVRLERGEAFFSVVKDPAHPFVVETAAGTVRVTGTKFNVRLEGDRAEVTLLEGSVALRHAAEEATLRPGEQQALDRLSVPPRQLSATEMENALSWRTGRLALDGLTLGEAAARFAAYHGKVIVVAPEVAAIRLGGGCPLDDLPGFLAFLGESFPLAVTTEAGGAVRIRAK